jgi:crossover junction endodeoxyribonuclease RuvC
MRVLGIDPGTINMGYGVVEAAGGIKSVGFGLLRSSSNINIEERLQYFYTNLLNIIEKFTPDEVAIEQPFIGKNIRAAFTMGSAQTVAILAAMNFKLPIYYYSPAKIKELVTSYGHSDKLQVKKMVMMQLGLREDPASSDVTDALATAICHIYSNSFRQWVEKVN